MRGDWQRLSCHLWHGPLDTDGYAIVLDWHDTWKRVDRAKWLVDRGPIPPGQSVAHLCHVPACHEIRHLTLQPTPEGQVEDESSLHVGRHTKLDAGKAAEIRAELAQGVKHGVLARQYGVSRTAIYNIASGRSW